MLPPFRPAPSVGGRGPVNASRPTFVVTVVETVMGEASRDSPVRWFYDANTLAFLTVCSGIASGLELGN